MKQLLFYFIIGLAAALVVFSFARTLSTNSKTSTQERFDEQTNLYQEQPPERLIEQEELYQHQLNLIEGHADIITEREADYLETMGHHSPEIRDQFPHVTQVELWNAVYEKELEHLDTFGRVSQRIVDQLIESREKAEVIERLFGDLKEQMR